MYQVGDYLIKTNTGLCKIEDIVHLDGMDKNKQYYLLVPLTNAKTKIYVSTERTSDGIRKVLTAEEAWEIIHNVANTEAIQIDNEKQREQKYKEATRSLDPIQWVSIIKTMYLRRQKRTEQGKRNTAMDEHYFKLAEDLLYSELAFAIGKDKNDMCEIIAQTIEE